MQLFTLTLAVSSVVVTQAGFSSSSSSSSSSSPCSNVTIPTTLGPVMGIQCDTYRAFTGIQYGTAERWESPVLQATPWTSPYDATHDPPGCPQVCTEDEPPHICPPTYKQKEQCLFLNVFTPAAATPATASPVLLFIHGGNFHDGYAGGYELDGGLLYDGSQYVNATGHIVVVINYRLGPFGFLYGGGAARGNTITGNYGLQDQVTAMEWVRANIVSYGGDPQRVTLMGQSAGAMSIGIHLTRPQTQGLYAGAIQHSNPHAEPYRTPPEAEAIAAGFANFTGCGADWVTNPNWGPLEACLKALPVPVIVAAGLAAELDILADLTAILQVVVAWGPTIGTPYIPLRPLEAFQAGAVNDVPIVIGTTANETVIFVYEALDFPINQLEYEAAVAVLVSPGEVGEIMNLYPVPPSPPTDFRVFASTVLTDALFLCPTRNASEALAVAQPFRKSPIYHYQYNHLSNWGPTMWGPNYTICVDYVCHGSDLPQWFLPQVSPGPGFGNYTQGETDLGHVWQRYWASFAETGTMGAPTPNGPTGGLVWPPYSAATRTTLEFRAAEDGGLRLITGLRDVTCAFWDRFGYSIY